MPRAVGQFSKLSAQELRPVHWIFRRFAAVTIGLDQRLLSTGTHGLSMRPVGWNADDKGENGHIMTAPTATKAKRSIGQLTVTTAHLLRPPIRHRHGRPSPQASNFSCTSTGR
jgi:hypothetical protein